MYLSGRHMFFWSAHLSFSLPTLAILIYLCHILWIYKTETLYLAKRKIRDEGSIIANNSQKQNKFLLWNIVINSVKEFHKHKFLLLFIFYTGFDDTYFICTQTYPFHQQPNLWAEGWGEKAPN